MGEPLDLYLLTVAEAAPLIGITERSLRDQLKRPEFAGRVLTATRNTATGTRQASVLPPDLVADIRARVEQHRQTRGATRSQTGSQTGKETGKETRNVEETRNVQEEPGGGETFTFSGAAPASSPPSDLALVVAAKDETIALLRAEVEHLRQSLTVALELAHREQTLRALPAPAAVEPEDGKKNGDGGRSSRGDVRARLRVKVDPTWPIRQVERATG